MTGNRANEEQSAGYEPAADHPNTGESESASAHRPFRAWASANEPRESAWFLLRSKVASIFSRKAVDPDRDAPETDGDAEEPAVDFEEIGEEVHHEASTSALGATVEDDDEPVVAPPRNFRFPWTRSQADGPAPVESLVDNTAESFDFDAAFDSAPAPASDQTWSSGTPDGTFDSVDDALPSGEVDTDSAGESIPETHEPRRGFFSRFFRKPRPTFDASDDAEGLEIEVHEDRIEAAAQALDEVGAEQFESFEGFPGAPPRPFESVDDALPATPPRPFESVDDALPVTPPLDDLPIVGDFASPADVSSWDAPVASHDWNAPEAALPSEPQIEPPQSDPSTARVTAEMLFPDIVLPADESQRTTAEVSAEDIPAITDFEITADGFDGQPERDGDRKTDELELATIEETTDPADLTEITTLEVEPRSFWKDSFIGRMFRRGDTEVEPVGAEAAEAAQASSAFLLTKFRAFYNEIIRFQHEKSEFAAGFATAILTDLTADVSPDASAEAVSRRLSELLELQAAEAKWMGGEAAERYPDAQYAMAALADDLFTHSEWEGQLAWPKVSLEHKLHNSRDADIELYRRIDRLLKEAPDSGVARDLARVYLLVLAAGFQGKWRPFGLMRPIAEYRRRLYEYVYGNDPLMLYAPDRKVFPEASSRTLEGHAVSRFTAMQRWTAVLALLVVTYTVVAHIAWTRVTADLQDVTTRIQTNTPPGAP